MGTLTAIFNGSLKVRSNVELEQTQPRVYHYQIQEMVVRNNTIRLLGYMYFVLAKTRIGVGHRVRVRRCHSERIVTKLGLLRGACGCKDLPWPTVGRMLCYYVGPETNGSLDTDG